MGNLKVVFDTFLARPEKLGGPGVEVEIDESKFGKRKYHRIMFGVSFICSPNIFYSGFYFYSFLSLILNIRRVYLKQV